MISLFILFSIISWFLLLLYGEKHPIRFVSSELGGSGGETTTTLHSYYYYKIHFAHQNIDASQSIIFYDVFGNVLQTVPPNYTYMDYGMGVLSVPGTEKNVDIESVSTATYYVFYSTDDLVVDYENAQFKLSKNLIRAPAQSTVSATYEYYTIVTPIKDVASVIDGKWDTQVQSVFYAEPPTGYNYAILDLGAAYSIQALDIVAGFFKPDDYRKYDVGMSLSLKYSTDGTTYSYISDNTRDFKLSGGESKSFEESDLGTDFSARYLRLILEKIDKIDFSSENVTVTTDNRQHLIDLGTITESTETGSVVTLRSGCWVTAFTEMSAYNDIILKSESMLIPTTQLTKAISTSSDSADFTKVVDVTSTEGFSSSGTAFIKNTDGTYDGFTYTSTTSTSFNGVQGLSNDHSIDDWVMETQEADDTYPDYEGLLPNLGDRLYKKMEVSNEVLYSQAELDYVTKRYLKEFQKNHTTCSIDVLFAPHLSVGDTVKLVDADNDIDRNYFISGITNQNNFYTISLAYYE